MKLVELLAREMKKWPEDCTYGYCMQANGSTQVFFGGPARSVFLSELADDRETAKVTTAQWQAERDRHKGGEWKRHRGGKCPVNAGTKVITRYRDGVVSDWCMTRDPLSSQQELDAIWSHSGGLSDIMAYKIEPKDNEEISQPQAEEVEVKDTTIGTLRYKVETDTSTATRAIDELAAKWDQVDGPLLWRDRVVELEAHAEDIQREIASLFAKLNAEGFQLIRQYPSVQQPELTVDMSNYRNWANGDILKCVSTRNTCAELTVGREYKAVLEGKDLGVKDDAGDHMCYCIENGNMVFVRRP